MMVSITLEQALLNLEANFTAKASQRDITEAERKEFKAKANGVNDQIKYVRRHGGALNVASFVEDKFKDDAFELRLDSIP